MPVMRRSFRTHPILQRSYPRFTPWVGMRRPVGAVPNTGTASVGHEFVEIGTGSVEEIGTGSEVP
jgi:hypothetical protein